MLEFLPSLVVMKGFNILKVIKEFKHIKIFKRTKVINISRQATTAGSRGLVSNPKTKPEPASNKV
jgi:hypothetical protein